MGKRTEKAKRFLVPVVLTVTVAGAVASVATSSGCGEDKPRIDAGPGDAGVDTPPI